MSHLPSLSNFSAPSKKGESTSPCYNKVNDAELKLEPGAAGFFLLPHLSGLDWLTFEPRRAGESNENNTRKKEG